MKRVIVLLCAGLIALTLFSCSKSDNTDASGNTDASVTDTSGASSDFEGEIVTIDGGEVSQGEGSGESAESSSANNNSNNSNGSGGSSDSDDEKSDDTTTSKSYDTPILPIN